MKLPTKHEVIRGAALLAMIYLNRVGIITAFKPYLLNVIYGLITIYFRIHYIIENSVI